MRFRCSFCDFVHDLNKDSYQGDIENATVAVGKWFESNNKPHQVIACLRCGTVHAVVRSRLQAIRSFGKRPYAIRFVLLVSYMQQLIDGVIGEYHVPDSVIRLPSHVFEALAGRGLLREPPEQSVAVPVEDNEATQAVALAFAQFYVLYCGGFQRNPAEPESLNGFIRHALENPDGQSYMVVMDVLEGLNTNRLHVDHLTRNFPIATILWSGAGLKKEYQSWLDEANVAEVLRRAYAEDAQ